MKHHDGHSNSKTKLFVLITCSTVGALLVLQYLESHYISFSLQILKRNTEIQDERQYKVPLKPLNVQQKRLKKAPNSEYETRSSAQRTELYSAEDITTTETGPSASKATEPNAAAATPSNQKETMRATAVTRMTTKNTTDTLPTKIILFYTPFFLDKPWNYFLPIKDYTKTCGCNFDHCEISYNIDDYTKADIVFFHARDMPRMSVLEELKKMAKKSQYWMYFVEENPFNAPQSRPLSHLFELAMTYRYNSDFPFPYGRYVKRKPEDKEDYTLDVAKTKSKQIAWMVSHCGTRRDKLAKYFQQNGLTIAVGGGCAGQYANKLHCSTKECIEEMSKYKFYFSAENNFCNQYITEKYWSTPFKINAVPIVLGGSTYSDPELAIPGSFIDAMDFQTPKDLVEYIKKVDSNDTLYNSYFKWKRYYKVFQEKKSGCSYAMCNLCDHLKKGIKAPKDILGKTINAESECRPSDRYFDQWIRSAE